MRIKIRVDKTILGKIWMFNHDIGLFAFNNKINFINIIGPSYVSFLPCEFVDMFTKLAWAPCKLL
jgi:hypothetical protein